MFEKFLEEIFAETRDRILEGIPGENIKNSF